MARHRKLTQKFTGQPLFKINSNKITYPLTSTITNKFTGLAGALDSAALAYVNALIAAGATVTTTQRNAINNFVLAEKAASRWSSYKRFYLPIWGVAAANAIDIITTGSGTFNGTVTHSAGYIKGDGSTGYFNTGVSNAGVGMTLSGGSVSVLIYTADTRNDVREFIGSTDGSNRRGDISQITNGLVASNIYSASSSAALVTSSVTGIITGTILANNNRYIQKRSSSLGIELTNVSTTDNTTAGTMNTFVCARNNNGTASLHSNAAIGAAVMSLGFTSTNNESFTANLKTLWETCTGLTLP